MKNTWPLQKAKNQFSMVVEDALNKGPQTITRRGKPTVVVMDVEAFRCGSTPTPTLSEFLIQSPLRDSGIKPQRFRDLPREVKL